MTVYSTVGSPLGELLLVGEKDTTGSVALTSLSFVGQRGGPTPQPGWLADATAFADVARQLHAYFAGDSTGFDLPVAARGTAFQRRVWAAIDTIPYGATCSYGGLTEQIGLPSSAVRAVAAAVGANPVLIVCPCHRVVGANTSLTGYAGGVPRKQELLVLEGALAPVLA